MKPRKGLSEIEKLALAALAFGAVLAVLALLPIGHTGPSNGVP